MRRIGLFPAIFGLVLLTLIVSQLVSAGLLVLIRPAPPAAMSVENVVKEIRGGEAPGRLRQQRQAEEPEADESAAARVFGAAIAEALGLPANDVRLSMARMQRGRLIYVDVGTEEEGAPRMVPTLVSNFALHVRDPAGGWRVWSPIGEAVFDTVEQRFVVLFILGALIMLPFALLMARRIALPFQRLAEAAEQLGQRPSEPVTPIVGPPEAVKAGRALIETARKLDAHVADRMLMVGALAHDLRTPLTRLAFRAEALPETERGGIAADIREMEAMIAETLAFVRGIDRRGPRERVELCSLIERVCDDLTMIGGAVTSCCPELVVVEGDRGALRRMFSNLILNALNYGGRAETRVQLEDGVAVVEVLDDGPGLSAANIARVFEPFYRVDASRNRHTGGIGLGLPFARMVAEAHGGDIELENRPEGGLIARVRLPAAGAEARAGIAAAQPRISATSIADQSVA